jgi:hypothetical protein
MAELTIGFGASNTRAELGFFGASTAASVLGASAATSNPLNAGLGSDIFVLHNKETDVVLELELPKVF